MTYGDSPGGTIKSNANWPVHFVSLHADCIRDAKVFDGLNVLQNLPALWDRYVILQNIPSRQRLRCILLANDTSAPTRAVTRRDGFESVPALGA